MRIPSPHAKSRCVGGQSHPLLAFAEGALGATSLCKVSEQKKNQDGLRNTKRNDRNDMPFVTVERRQLAKFDASTRRKTGQWNPPPPEFAPIIGRLSRCYWWRANAGGPF